MMLDDQEEEPFLLKLATCNLLVEEDMIVVGVVEEAEYAAPR
jgi:hypothetical protein